MTDNQMIKLKNRIVYLDALRCIAIFAVISVHVCAYYFYRFGARTFIWQVAIFYDSLFRFCVPVFVMVSGVFLLNPEHDYSIKKIFFKKLVRFFVSYLFWAVVYALYSNRIEFQKDGLCFSNVRIIISNIIIGHYHLWFMWMITGLYIVTPILRTVVQNEKVAKYFLILCSVFCCVNVFEFIPLPHNGIIISLSKRLDISFVGSYSGYFVWGYWLSSHKLFPNIRKVIYVLGGIAVFSTIIITGGCGYYFDKPCQCMFGYSMPNVILMSTAIFVFFQYNFETLHLSPKCQKLVVTIGRLTLGIFYIHVFLLECIINVMELTTEHCNPVMSIPAISLTTFAFSCVAILILDRIPLVNKYVI